MKLLSALFLSISLCFSSIAQAADSIKLSTELVEQWLASYQHITQWSEDNQAALDEVEASYGDLLSMDDMSAVENHPLYKEFTQQLAKDGFSDPNYWSDVAERIMLTFMLNMDPNLKESFAQLGFMQDMLENTDLPDEQKAELKQQVEQLQASANTLKNISPEEQKIVEKFTEQLSKLMDEAEQY